MRVTVITHNDNDGVFCGGIVKLAYPDAQIINTNYGRTVKFSQLEPGQLLFITDYCFPIETMKDLEDKYKLVWIDHHPVIDEYAELGFNPKGIRSKEHSAAYLTWQYLFPNEPVPISVKYVSDYDIWAHEYPESLLFFYGIGTIDLYLNNNKGMDIFNKLIYNIAYVESILAVGKSVHNYVTMHNEILCKDSVFETSLDGHSALVCNIKNVNSMLFDSIDKKTDILILFSYFSNIDQYRVSLFSRDGIPVNEIAKKYGGGGHPGAAGFSCKQLPFKIPVPICPHPEYKDIFYPLKKIMDDEPLVRKYVDTGIVPLFLSHMYEFNKLHYETFVDKKDDQPSNRLISPYRCICVNHPSVHNEIFYATGANFQYDLGICVALTNSGWYRYRIYVLNPLINLTEVKEYIGVGEIINNALWVYSKKLVICYPTEGI